MSDQNNNNNQNQPQQGQPQQPYQGQPQQPYQGQPQQPYQGQPQQPYQGQPQQPYQGQPQQPYQPYQPYKPYQGQPPVPPKKKSKWWIWLIVAAVVILAVVALFVFGVIDLGGKRPGNEGAWATYDYFDSREDAMKNIQSKVYSDVADRFESEAFEAEGELSLDSELFSELMPEMDGVNIDFEAKYDLKDLGLKLDLGVTSADVYLIEEDVVLSVLGEAYSIPLDPNTDVDLSDEMPLTDRLNALNSLAADEDFSDLMEKIMMELAPAIPDELTEKDTVDIYSPLEGDEVEMTAITTTLDSDDIYDIIVTFGENLEENDELLDELQDLADTLSEASGEDIDIEEVVEDMIDLDEDELEEIEDAEISWSVYEYRGESVGFGFYLDDGEDEYEFTVVTQYTKNAAYISVIFDYNGDEVANLIEERVYADEYMTIDAEIELNIPEDEYTEAQQITMTISGETTLDQDNSSDYAYSGEFSIELDAGDSLAQAGYEGDIGIDVDLNADITFGDDLGMLEDDSDWDEIYDMDWEDIDNLFENLGNFGGLGNFGAFDDFSDF